ncbi:MAG: helix-turn-helix domain-containing protein [Acidobacteriota bacterium]|nr:helix-turn-helix domain-containing protein [Acidobacteriota bacterium]
MKDEEQKLAQAQVIPISLGPAGLSFEQAARYVGVSERTLRRKMLSGEVAPVRINRRVLFLRRSRNRSCKGLKNLTFHSSQDLTPT